MYKLYKVCFFYQWHDKPVRDWAGKKDRMKNLRIASSPSRFVDTMKLFEVMPARSSLECRFKVKQTHSNVQWHGHRPLRGVGPRKSLALKLLPPAETWARVGECERPQRSLLLWIHPYNWACRVSTEWKWREGETDSSDSAKWISVTGQANTKTSLLFACVPLTLEWMWSKKVFYRQKIVDVTWRYSSLSRCGNGFSI